VDEVRLNKVCRLGQSESGHARHHDLTSTMAEIDVWFEFFKLGTRRFLQAIELTR
jgi:hypothetical protein